MNDIERMFEDNFIDGYLQLDEANENSEEERVNSDSNGFFSNNYEFGLTKIIKEDENDEELNSSPQKKSSTSSLSFSDKRPLLIIQLEKLNSENQQLKLKNNFLYKKCCNVIVKLKTTDILKNMDYDVNMYEDTRYIDALRMYRKIKSHKKETEDSIQHELSLIEMAYQSQSSEFLELFDKLICRKSEIRALICKGTKETKIPPIMNLINKQKQRMSIVTEARIRFLRLKYLLQNIHNKLDKSNILDKGYTIVKYENLMMLKNTLSEKVEKRGKNLYEIRNKLCSIVHKLAHIKEVSIGMGLKIEKVTMELKKCEEIKRKKRIELLKTGRQKELVNIFISKMKSLQI